MVNGIYFNVYRDDESESTWSEFSSRRSDFSDKVPRSSVYSTINKRIRSWIRFRLPPGRSPKMLSFKELSPKMLSFKELSPEILSFKKLSISLGKLNELTGNFGDDSLVAQGMYGQVFRVTLSTGEAAAVKKNNPDSFEGSDSDFAAELSRVSRLKHNNFVKLLGYCLEEENRILVHEFATMGSLHDILHGRKGIKDSEPGPVLTWDQRVKIACDAAVGLEYLHNEGIVHGAISSSNILIFDDFVSKIADIRLSRTDSYGFIPSLKAKDVYPSLIRWYYVPEGWGNSLSDVSQQKSDIYRFGVVLLELLTGRKEVDTWAKPRLGEDKVNQCIDPKLNTDYPPKAVERMAAIAELCVQYETEFRPNMKTVVKVIQSLVEVGETSKPVQSYASNELGVQGEPPVHSYASNKLLLSFQELSISLVEVSKLTGNFGDKSLVAQGMYGQVFRATLSTGEAAAVKKNNPNSFEGSDFDFAAELSRVSRLKHNNFVKLLGYCLEEENRILVHEFATMGSLHDILHGRKGLKGSEPGPVLTWDQRVKIACDAAVGLEYLHNEGIVHGAISSSNILIFDDFVSKIADIRLSRTGSYGFIPSLKAKDVYPSLIRWYYVPEGWGSSSPDVSQQKSDIYRFGVVLLELLTGREEVNTWAKPRLRGDRIYQCIDTKLNTDYPPKAVERLAAIAFMCVKEKPVFRPDMNIVVEAMRALLES